MLMEVEVMQCRKLREKADDLFMCNYDDASPLRPVRLIILSSGLLPINIAWSNRFFTQTQFVIVAGTSRRDFLIVYHHHQKHFSGEHTHTVTGQIFDDFRLHFSHQKALIDAFPTIPMQSSSFVNGRTFVDFGDLLRLAKRWKVYNTSFPLFMTTVSFLFSYEHPDERKFIL